MTETSTNKARLTGLITLHRVHNFGSVLQTYATQSLLKEHSIDSVVLDYWRPSEIDTIRGQLSHNYAKWNTSLPRRSAFVAMRGAALKRQSRNFRAFVEGHLTTSRPLYSIDDLRREVAERALTTVVAGSDQIWNADYNVSGSEPFFLAFAGQGVRRLSIASSFGKAELSDAELKYVRAELPRFSSISVRESSAVAALAKEGIKATHVVDPTLGIHPDRWRSLASAARVPNEPYLLAYHLHRSRDIGPVVDEVSRRKKLKVVWVRGYGTTSRSHDLSNTRPEEFLGLLSDASHVVTDSFHGTAFSLNLGVPFSPVLPPAYGERIRSLLSLTNTSANAVSDPSELTLPETDTDGVERVLASERLRLSTYIGEAFA